MNTQKVAQLVLPYLNEELHDGRRLDALIDASTRACHEMVQRGRKRWYVMYSGGKDSTAAAILCLQSGAPADIEVIYCDTMLEIPTLHAAAMHTLNTLAARGVRTRILTRSVNDSFWVLLIGRGYIAPHRLFRWCTQRLKIKPVEQYLRAVGDDPREVLIVTGVRFGESDARNLRLRLSCARGGECGHGVWYEHSGRLGYGYFSPIVVWRECDVWDFLNLIAPSWGYPTQHLAQVYADSQSRFGCWTCTVVQRDKAMESLVQLQPQYAALLELRNWLQLYTRDPANRVRKPDGQLGRLTMQARREILQRVLDVQTTTAMPVISAEELDAIHACWASGAYGDAYD